MGCKGHRAAPKPCCSSAQDRKKPFPWVSAALHREPHDLIHQGRWDWGLSTLQLLCPGPEGTLVLQGAVGLVPGPPVHLRVGMRVNAGRQ